MDATETDARRGRRRAVVVPVLIAGVMLSGLGVLTSGALFSTADENTGSYTDGVVIVDAERRTEFTLDNNHIDPGDTVTGTVSVENRGSLRQRYTITSRLADPEHADRRYARALQAVLSDEAGEVLYTGRLADLKTLPRHLDPLEGEELAIAVSMPLTADDSLQGGTSDWVLRFDAVQVRE
ncbi:hypothetical protein [Nocardioides pakistanensis]